VTSGGAYGGAVPKAAGHGSLVDWDLAARVGARLARPGPSLPPQEARDVVVGLRASAAEARAHVRAYTGLDAPVADAPVEVIDRPAWIRANAEGMRRLLEPLEEVLRGRRLRPPREGVRRVGGALTGTEVGAALGWLSGKVLGQFEVYADADTGGPGRLLLIAPNIAQVERELDVHHGDFRLWVCLHEETHRVQFTAVPWLRDHVLAEVRSLVAGVGKDADPGVLAARAREVVGSLARAARGEPSPSLAELLQGPEQRERMARLTAVMSLLEGHADVVMDGVGPQVVPSVEEIRAKFQRRRDEPGRAEAALRRVLGLDAKLRQYRDGAAFVRAVVATAGMEGFNRVWEQPANLPTPHEIRVPAAWTTRVLDSRA
jgi:coenzyme F420 biosynthesis associated uncharacterized protein